MMKKYVESKNQSPVDWNAFLNKETYSLIEVSNAHYLAGSWVTCACGNQCEIIPRSISGRPIDDKLAELGCDFCMQLFSMYQKIKRKYKLILVTESSCIEFKQEIKEMKKTLTKIEKRSAKLIEIELNK